MKKSIIVCLCCMLCFMTGCGKKNVNTGESVDLFFLNADGSKMVTERRNAPQGEDDLLSFAVNELLKGPSSSDNKRAIPKGTALIDIKLADGIATVNLSEAFNGGSDVEKLNARYTMINTVCSLPGVSKTQLLVEGKTLTSISTGEALGAMGREDIVTDTAQVANNEVVVTLYYSDSNAMYLVAESRKIALKEGEKLEQAIVTELLKGPKNKSLSAVLSPEIKVLSTETKDGVCFVNLSQEFISKAPGGSAWETLAVYSIVNSLCDVRKIDKVQILVEGKKIDGFGHMDLSQPCAPNADLSAQQ